MMQRDALEAVGCYDERFPAGEDRDLWLRLAERGPLANLDEVLLMYRCLASSISNATADQQTFAFKALEAAYRRRGLAVPPEVPRPDGIPMTEADCKYRWAMWAINSGHYATAWKHGFPMLWREPLSLRTARFFVRWTRAVLASRRERTPDRAFT